MTIDITITKVLLSLNVPRVVATLAIMVAGILIYVLLPMEGWLTRGKLFALIWGCWVIREASRYFARLDRMQRSQPRRA
jgi:hypothetical protein